MEKKTKVGVMPTNCKLKEDMVNEIIKKYEVCATCGFQGELYDSCPRCKHATFNPTIHERKVVLEEIDDSIVN